MSENESEKKFFDSGLIVIFLMLMVYMSFEAFKHKHHLSFGHEASLVTLIGFGISYYVYYTQTDEIIARMQFNDDLFFYLCLPPIVFASGFNMQRGKFFSNFSNIMLFGLVGTLIAFSTFAGLTIAFQKSYPNALTQWDTTTETYVPLVLSTMEVMLMCSLLCSSDVIAAVSMIDGKEKPKLFSVVFGEGITNDAVSIILFNTVVKFTRENEEFNAGSPFVILGDFIALGFYSLLTGFIFGLACAYLLKRCRSYSKSAVSEISIIFVFGYVSYVTAELFAISGIITLLTSGMVMSNYAWYNLSPQGRQTSCIVFNFLGFATEGFVFTYLGLTFFSYIEYPWSEGLILLEMSVILVGRGLGTFGLYGLLSLCGYQKQSANRLSCGEICFVYYAGLIRGAIAFGLVLRLDDSVVNRKVIVTTCLTLVIFTTVFFGSTVGLLGKCLLNKKKTEIEDEGEGTLNTEKLSEASYALSEKQIYEPLIHPNAEQQDMADPMSFAQQVSEEDRGFVYYCLRFDEFILKPIFVYKYDKQMAKRIREFYDMMAYDGVNVENKFVKNATLKRAQTRRALKEGNDGQSQIIADSIATGKDGVMSSLMSVRDKRAVRKSTLPQVETFSQPIQSVTNENDSDFQRVHDQESIDQ